MTAAIRLLLLIAVAVSLGAAVAPPPAGKATCAVLVTIDTLRADHVSAYGYPRPTTPFLDSLAAGGALFSNAYAPGSHTAPSHASLFTGWFPLQHGVRKNGQALPLGIGTLAESMRDAGYDTAAVSSVAWLKHIGRGFDTFYSTGNPRLPPGSPGYRAAREIVDLGATWLEDEARGDRRFLWVHFFDVHEWDNYLGNAREWQEPWSETAKFLHRRAPIDTPEFRSWLAKTHGTPPSLLEGSWPAIASSFSSYDARLRYVDRELQRLERSVGSECASGATTWIITSDHGEGLFDHHFIGHGRHLFGEQLHIPLVLHAPGRVRDGIQVDEIVRLVDIPPTLAELHGTAWNQGEGISLLPLADGSAEAWPILVNFAQRRPAGKRRISKGWEPGEVFAIHDKRTKYIRRTEATDLFFSLARDPHERRNRARSPEAGRWKQQADALWAALAARAPGTQGGGEVDPAMVEQLRALGYIVD